MKDRDIEKKIYKLLGVNLFRKYILGPYGKLIKVILKDNHYKIHDFSSKGLEDFKEQSKYFAKVHMCCLVVFNLSYLYMTLSGKFNACLLGAWMTNNFIDLYSIMANRQHCIRIDEILEKREGLEKETEDKDVNETGKNSPRLAVVKMQKLNANTTLLSLKEQREELEKFKELASTMRPANNQNQVFINQEQDYTRALESSSRSL